jgi:hypothetical protein
MAQERQFLQQSHLKHIIAYNSFNGAVALKQRLYMVSPLSQCFPLCSALFKYLHTQTPNPMVMCQTCFQIVNDFPCFHVIHINEAEAIARPAHVAWSKL